MQVEAVFADCQGCVDVVEGPARIDRQRKCQSALTMERCNPDMVANQHLTHCEHREKDLLHGTRVCKAK